MYPYHADKTQANDTLYGRSEEFLLEVHGILTNILEQVKTILTELASFGANLPLQEVSEKLATSLILMVDATSEEDANIRDLILTALRQIGKDSKAAPGRWLVSHLEQIITANNNEEKQRLFARQCLSIIAK